MARTRLRVLLPAAAVALFALALPKRAHAYERQWHLGGTIGYTGLIGSTNTNGFGGGIHLDYGLTDAFNIMTAVNVSVYPDVGAVIPTAAVGVGYVFDVLQWVPYIGGLVGAGDIWIRDPTCDTSPLAVPCHQPKLSLEAPFGIDYMVNRSFALGLAGRYNVLVSGTGVNQLIGAYVKAEYVWGY